MTMVLEAASAGDANKLTALAQSGHDLTIADQHGATAAHLAARHGHVACIRALAERDPELLQMPDARGNAAAHYAASAGQAHVIEMLVKLRVNVNAQNYAGKTPAHRAVETCPNSEVLVVLERAGVDVKSIVAGDCGSFVAVKRVPATKLMLGSPYD